jgi:hypothetical protein
VSQNWILRSCFNPPFAVTNGADKKLGWAGHN